MAIRETMRKIDAFSRCIKIWFSIYWSRPKIGLSIGFFWVAYFCFANICKDGNLQTAIIKNERPKSRKFVDCRRKFEDSPQNRRSHENLSIPEVKSFFFAFTSHSASRYEKSPEFLWLSRSSVSKT